MSILVTYLMAYRRQ